MKTTTINNVTNTIAIISFWGDAPEYNHELSHDGGSYYQPCGVALLRIGISMWLSSSMMRAAATSEVVSV